MARRRIIHEEEVEEEKEKKPAFQPSEFNETEFLQTENKSAKMIYISLGVAVVAGLVSFGIMRILYPFDTGLHFTIPLISPVGFAILVVYLFGRFGIDIKELEWKKWLENGFMYILAWFVIWMLSMNPPISDFSDPQIQPPVLELKTAKGNFTYIDDTLFINELVANNFTQSHSDKIPLTSDVYVYCVITDNNKVERVDITVQYLSAGSYIEFEDLSSAGITIDRDHVFEPTDELEDRVDNVWLQTDPEAWEGHLWTVHFDMSLLRSANLTAGDQDDILQLKVNYNARDTWDNDADTEFIFKIRV
ncbi:MAG: hypothetical protein ACMUHU_02460 [Thermoplasmatota archaeon]